MNVVTDEQRKSILALAVEAGLRVAAFRHGRGVSRLETYWEPRL
jgi:hypothetical protein